MQNPTSINYSHFYNGLGPSEISTVNRQIFHLNNAFFINQAPTSNPEFYQSTAQNPHLRDAARCLLKNSDQQIYLLYSKARDYYAIPGGGIETNEALIEALRRETLEETGFSLKHPKPIGKIYEERNNRITHTYFFSAEADQFLGTNYMEDEIEEDYQLVWLSISDALLAFQNHYHKLKSRGFDSYKGSFIVARYLKTLEFVSNLQNF